MERQFQPAGDRCEKVAGSDEKSAVHKIKQGLTACLFRDTMCKLDFSVGRGLFLCLILKTMEVEVVRTKITLECTECKQRNYDMMKDKKTHPERMETKKYCKFCKRHTLHKETK